MITPTIDRLKVFVSSTIKECSAERAAVRDAIRSINQEPVLFEDIGARPHPPRELYKVRLEISQIFVAIYRESYGWIAPDMNISGVEDEFRIAASRGMDRLVYVYGNPSARDPKLEALIETAKNAGITISTYATLKRLREQVRNDLTAVISNRFMDQLVISGDAPKASEIIQSLVPNPVHRFRRPDVEASLLKAFNNRLLVTAALGAGKTMLLATLSAENGWIFIDGQGLNRLDLLARMANAIREQLGRPPVTFTTEQGATLELLNGCKSVPDTVLIVDGAQEPEAIWDLPKSARLIVSSRSAFQVPSEQRFDIPQLTGDEVKNWVSVLRGAPPGPSELAIIMDRSGGSPLYLRFFALGGDRTTDLSLRELEIRALESLPPRSREIATYLALSGRPFSLGDLHALVGGGEGPEGVAGNLALASGLLKQTRGRVQLVHEHLRATVQAQLRQTPTRLAFFATRLGRYFEHVERYVPAFHVYFQAGELRHADRLLDRAANEAAIMGGGAPAITIFRRQAELAREAGQHDKGVHSLLNLAFALDQTGARDDAAHALGDARSIAQKHNLKGLLLRVNEMEIILNVRGVSRTERIHEFEALREKYSSNGDRFNMARLGTLVTSEYIMGSDFDAATRVSRDALEAFTNVGDEYGIRVARINLATALSGIDGSEHEAAALAHDLEKELDPENYPRERAVLCNLLTRYYRESGNTSRAAEFALEAISIGEQLGDKRLITINRTNLGNVRRDEGALDQALLEYRSAEQAAISAGDRENESAANELIASVLSEQKCYREALPHAEHASALARQVKNQRLIARAEEERAIALEGQRQLAGALDAYAEAANAIAEIRPGGSYFASLLTKALHLSVMSNRIDLKIGFLQKVFSSKNAPTHDEIPALQVLYAALPKIAGIIEVHRLLPIIALLMADFLADVPLRVERRIVLQAIEALLESTEAPAKDGTLVSVSAVLLAHSSNCLTLADLVDIAERVARPSKRIYFKPMDDGAAHWTIRLDIAGGVIVSIVQLDDSQRTAVTTAIVALLLFTLDDFIRERLLEVESLPRHEAIINIVSRKDIEAQIDPKLLNLGDMPNGFAIMESTDFTVNDQPPIVTICADDFPRQWHPNTYKLSDIHLLLTELLRVMSAHLVGKSIEHEVLFPKIISIIHMIGYEGVAARLHSREDTSDQTNDD